MGGKATKNPILILQPLLCTLSTTTTPFCAMFLQDHCLSLILFCFSSNFILGPLQPNSPLSHSTKMESSNNPHAVKPTSYFSLLILLA